MGELNLIPYKIKLANSKKSKIKQYLAVLIIIIAALMISVYYPRHRLDNLRAQEKDLQFQLKHSKDILSKNEKQSKEIVDIKAYIKKTQVLSSEKTIISDRISDLSGLMPTSISLKSLNFENSKISITGVTSSYNSIYELEANLKMSKDYVNATVTSIAEEKDQYTFSINIQSSGGSTNEKTK